MARIRAVLRRSGAPEGVRRPGGRGGPADPVRRQVIVDGSTVGLTTVEYDVLEFLLHAAGRIVSRDELTAALYRRRSTKFDRTLDAHICNLRRKLGEHGDLIQTVRGVGYLFRIGPGDPGSV